MDKIVSQADSLAKNAAAFFRRSRSCSSRLFSARRRCTSSSIALRLPPAGECLRALGVELLFPGADLGVAQSELAGGFGVREALLGDELHRLELVLAYLSIKLLVDAR